MDVFNEAKIGKMVVGFNGLAEVPKNQVLF